MQTNSRRVVGCLSLEQYGADLAEIRSVAVDPNIRGCGMGSKLVAFALRRSSQERAIGRVFAVTHAPEFFERHGFVASSRKLLTEKIARDCCACAKRRSCKLVAVTRHRLPERIMLPILGDSGKSDVRRMKSHPSRTDIPRGFTFFRHCLRPQKDRPRPRSADKRDTCRGSSCLHHKSGASRAGLSFP